MGQMTADMAARRRTLVALNLADLSAILDAIEDDRRLRQLTRRIGAAQARRNRAVERAAAR